MTWSHVHRETGELVGDPDDASLVEITGEAPPCDECGERQAVERVGDADLCGDCLPT